MSDDEVIPGSMFELSRRIRALEAELTAMNFSRDEQLRLRMKAEAEVTSLWLKIAGYRKERDTLEGEAKRLQTENNTLKIAILEAGLTPPGWVELAGGGREVHEPPSAYPCGQKKPGRLKRGGRKTSGRI